MGHWRYAIAKDFGITESAISRIVNGSRHADATGIVGAGAANDRHANLLLRQIAEDPTRAPVARSAFDQKFGPGAAVKVLKRVLTAGVR